MSVVSMLGEGGEGGSEWSQNLVVYVDGLDFFLGGAAAGVEGHAAHLVEGLGKSVLGGIACGSFGWGSGGCGGGGGIFAGESCHAGWGFTLLFGGIWDLWKDDNFEGSVLGFGNAGQVLVVTSRNRVAERRKGLC